MPGPRAGRPRTDPSAPPSTGLSACPGVGQARRPLRFVECLITEGSSQKPWPWRGHGREQRIPCSRLCVPSSLAITHTFQQGTPTSGEPTTTTLRLTLPPPIPGRVAVSAVSGTLLPDPGDGSLQAVGPRAPETQSPLCCPAGRFPPCSAQQRARLCTPPSSRQHGSPSP